MNLITLLTGSTSGGTEYIGDYLANLLTRNGHDVNITNMGELSDILYAKRLLLVTSTHGAGDYPESIAPLMDKLEYQSPDLSHLHFAVIAIGDSSYDTFCGAGKRADKLLEKLGGQRDIKHLEIDVLAYELPEELAEVWLSRWEKTFNK
ncbi:FMN-binding protein MioC [Candidatus Enterovibrio altilux]|uniref:Flavoprotein MioC n=1 Tax=Candidatus Enterovibrio altilux TaxID=1927128 RepID=A0A291B967_9GAMM|nr:FMN-binding protein MioC [Candidatus Enterovibrio luxaltus]ATF09523.1 Flavoprotein MioC [Candidatus Enterovibrio luxaltus]